MKTEEQCDNCQRYSATWCKERIWEVCGFCGKDCGCTTLRGVLSIMEGRKACPSCAEKVRVFPNWFEATSEITRLGGFTHIWLESHKGEIVSLAARYDYPDLATRLEDGTWDRGFTENTTAKCEMARKVWERIKNDHANRVFRLIRKTHNHTKLKIDGVTVELRDWNYKTINGVHVLLGWYGRAYTLSSADHHVDVYLRRKYVGSLRAEKFVRGQQVYYCSSESYSGEDLEHARVSWSWSPAFGGDDISMRWAATRDDAIRNLLGIVAAR